MGLCNLRLGTGCIRRHWTGNKDGWYKTGAKLPKQAEFLFLRWSEELQSGRKLRSMADSGVAMVPTYRTNIAIYESCKALLAVILYQLALVSLSLLHGLELFHPLLVTFLGAWHAN